MAIANYFYHGLTKKYVKLFGETFNKMTIKRYDSTGAEVQHFPVPIMYSPWQKFLVRLKADPSLKHQTSMVLPAMSFEIDNIIYDPLRKIHSQNLLFSNNKEDGLAFTPVPYTIHFSLHIWSQTIEDGTQILEQILPFFQPDYTQTVFLIPDFEPIDIPIVMESIANEDIYEGVFEQRRAIKWHITFVMSAFFFGPIRKKKVIKFIDVKLKADSKPNFVGDHDVRITTQPGLTINGEPTTDISQTIPYQDILAEDDWGVITIIEETFE